MTVPKKARLKAPLNKKIQRSYNCFSYKTLKWFSDFKCGFKLGTRVLANRFAKHLASYLARRLVKRIAHSVKHYDIHVSHVFFQRQVYV